MGLFVPVAIERIALSFGVPLAPEKTEGPTTTIKFLGIQIDSERMECSLLDDKVMDLWQVVLKARQSKKIRLRDFAWQTELRVQDCSHGSGFLQMLDYGDHRCQVSLPFCVTVALREDLLVWGNFLDCFNLDRVRPDESKKDEEKRKEVVLFDSADFR